MTFDERKSKKIYEILSNIHIINREVGECSDWWQAFSLAGQMSILKTHLDIVKSAQEDDIKPNTYFIDGNGDNVAVYAESFKTSDISQRDLDLIMDADLSHLPNYDPETGDELL